MFWKKYKDLPRNVWALSFVSLLNDTSSEIIYPLLPTFLALTLGASPFAIGAIEGIAESTASLLKLFSGYLSDRFNSRKLPVFIGYALSSIVRPLLVFVATWQQVLFVRLTDRVGKGIRGAPRDALLAAEVPYEKRGFAFGFNRAADHLGAVIGPIIASILLWIYAVNPNIPTVSEYQSVFLLASIPIVIGLFIIVFFVKEDGKDELADPIEKASLKLLFKEFDENFRQFRKFFGYFFPIFLFLFPLFLLLKTLKNFDRNFKRFLIVIALFTLSNSTDAFLLLRAGEAGVPTALLPILWMVLHLSKVVSSLIGGSLSDKFGRKKLIFSGWMVYALVYLGFAFVSEAWQAWALFIIYGVYFGLTEGAEKALVADLVPSKKRGTAFGLYNLAFGITVFPASLLLGGMWSLFGASAAFIFSAGLSILAAIFLLTVSNSAEEKESATN